MKKYISRSIERVLLEALEEFPCVVLTGPRQAGKSTLLKHLLGDRYGYVSLERPEIKAAAKENPKGFFELYPAPMIFDEVQHVPDLLIYIKEKIDENRSLYGQYILTGSQNLLMLKHVTETLAGRAAILKLLPLSHSESVGEPDRRFEWEGGKGALNKSSLPLQLYWENTLRGNFPELVEGSKKNISLWFSSYVQTYLERDVRDLRQLGDLSEFQLFIKMVAIRSGQLFKLSEVARSIGVAVNTIKAWLAILEATYQVIVVRPYYANMNKRLVKTPKVYFSDTGLLCHLTGIHDVSHLISGPMGGSVVENAVFLEIYKRFLGLGREPQIYFWRTASGEEVDFLVEDNGQIIPIEVKSSATPKSSMADGILSFRRTINQKCHPGYVVHLGDTKLPLKGDVIALPFRDF